MDDKFFRILTAEEEEKFRVWARDNWKPNTDPKSIWHPVVRDEWAKLTKGSVTHPEITAELADWRARFVGFGPTPFTASEKVRDTIGRLSEKWSRVQSALLTEECMCDLGSECLPCLLLDTYEPGTASRARGY